MENNVFSGKPDFVLHHTYLVWRYEWPRTVCRSLWPIFPGPTYFYWGGWVVRWCWVNFQCRGVLLIWILVGQGPTSVAVGAGGGVVWTFFLSSVISLFTLPLSGRRSDIDWNAVWKGRKAQNNQPTNQLTFNLLCNRERQGHISELRYHLTTLLFAFVYIFQPSPFIMPHHGNIWNVWHLRPLLW